MTIPYICLFSKDEDTPLGQEYGKVLMGNSQARNNVFETYGTMHHGWMGARADLKDEENAKEYVRGYEQAAEFFKKWL
jgi:dienelactone hydrolase